MKITTQVQLSFNRIKEAAIEKTLIISATELREKIIFTTAPTLHLKKLQEAGLIEYKFGKRGSSEPLMIKVL